MPEEKRTPRNRQETEATVVVRTVANVIEAALARDALADADIPCILESFSDGAFDGVLTAARGWGRVRVPLVFEDRARAVVDDALEPETDDEDTEGI